MSKKKFNILSDEDDFVPYIGKLKAKGKLKPGQFIRRIRALAGGFKLRSNGAKRGRSKGGFCPVRLRQDKFSQRVVVKGRFVNLNTKGGVKGVFRHVRYLERDGVSKEGERGEVFTKEGKLDTHTLKAEVQEWAKDRHYWRFIVSPEFGSKLDLNEFATDLIEGLEGDLNSKLKCFFVPHYNTDKPHLHLIIRGKREDGTDLILPRDYVANGIRELAERIVTRKLGPRFEKDILQQQRTEVKQERFVTLDRISLYLARKNGGLLDLRIRPKGIGGEKRDLRIARLKFLKELGLSNEVKPGIWTMRENSEEVLRMLGTRGDVIKTMHSIDFGTNKDLIFLNDSACNYAPITLRIIHIGLADELNDSRYFLAEGLDGKAYHVDLKKISRRGAGEERVGDIITLKSRQLLISTTKTDLNIFKISSIHNGIYNEALHKAFVLNNVKLPKNVSIDDYLNVHKRRLIRLKAKGLVRKKRGGSYEISKDFLLKLEAYTKDTKPEYIMDLEIQSRRPLTELSESVGATWLDEFIANGGARDKGFTGSFYRDVQEASVQRLGFLEKRGEVISKSNEYELREGFIERLYKDEIFIEGKAIASKFAAALNIISLRKFEGKFKGLEELPSGTHGLFLSGNEVMFVPYKKEMDRFGKGDTILVNIETIVSPEALLRPKAHRTKINFKNIIRKKNRKRS